MDAPKLPSTLAAAWKDLTPRHQALILAMTQALAAEDRLAAQRPAPADPSALVQEAAPGDYASVIRNFAMHGPVPTPEPSAWLRSVGMFDDNSVMDEIWEAGRRIREAERAE